MNEHKFSWIPAYETIATALLGYEEKQTELCSLVEKIIDEHYKDMDPLTFFSMFNGKRASFDKRTEAVKAIIERFGLDVKAPMDFYGLPVTNPLRWRYWDGKPDTIQHNWEFFHAALAYANNPTGENRVEFARMFDVVHAQGNVGDANLTMALYWIRPNAFLPADSNTRTYLRNRFDIIVPSPIKGDEYLTLLDDVRKKTQAGFPQISFEAWELGGWVPAPSEYDPGITADAWEELLRNGDVTSANALTTLRCLAKHPKGVTCAELDDDYGRGSNFYNSNVSTLGEAVCKRLGVKPREFEGSGKYWPVLCVGSYVGKSRHGSFEWKLRPELAEAVGRLSDGDAPLVASSVRERVSFDKERLSRLMELYKQDFPRFRVPGSGGGDQEAYKWVDAQAYKDNWDIDAEDFAGSLREALKPASTGQGALLGNGFSYPYGRLTKLVEFDQEGIREAFRILYDSERPLRDAYNGFCDAVDAVLQEHNDTADKPLEGSHQTPSAVSIYLAFEAPERYHIFKPAICTDFAERIGASLPANAVSKMLTYEALADAVMPELQSDESLIAMCDGAISEELRAVDPSHHLVLQDIAHYASRYLPHYHPDWKKLIDGEEQVTDSDEPSERDGNVKYPKNLILYGPPGTGKTYRTRAYAVAICDGLEVESVIEAMADPDGFADVSARYDELVSQGRVGFTTFHQSYGYEEFIEGLRPEYDEDKGVVTYPLRKGVFRDFCEAAEDVVAIASADEGIPRFAGNPRPRVWKMGLKTSGVADLLERCRAEGTLRMGWDDVTPDGVEDSKELSDQNRRAINAFQEEMQPGDFVVIPGAVSSRYDVAVVTGDFEWDEGLPGARRKRAAQWLEGISKADFLPLNGGKALTLQTVYELTRVSPSKLLEAMGLSDEKKVSPNYTKPYVFIIDEINRGNVSKVFGELITLLEPTKRKGAKEETLARLPYSGELFGIPENVHVLGTMNTADRSIALMDTALRRRFEFVELMPEPALLSSVEVEGVDVARMLGVMNARIELLYDREHTLGHAYLMDLRDEPSLERLARAFETRLIPLLQEYFFDDYAKIRSVLGAAADSFIEMSEGGDVFWGDDADEYDRLRSYRVLQVPREAEPYKLIYKTGVED